MSEALVYVIKAKNGNDMDKNFSHWHEKNVSLSSLCKNRLPLDFTVKWHHNCLNNF